MKQVKLSKIKGFRLLALLLCLAASVPQLWADVTIFVRGTAPYIYVYSTNGTAPNDGSTSWPGVKMTQSTTSQDGTVWYYTNYEGLNSCSIIFNNGSGGNTNQTWDITGVSGTQYFHSNGSNYYLNLTSVKDKTAYAFCENSSNWSGNLYAYCWNGTYSNNWNGEQMSFVGGTNGGRSVYAWSTNAGTPGMIIFNNGNSGEGNQTADAPFRSRGALHMLRHAGNHEIETSVITDQRKNSSCEQRDQDKFAHTHDPFHSGFFPPD